MAKLLMLAACAAYLTGNFALNIPLPVNISEVPSGSQCGISSVSQGRIIAGVQAKPGAWPWMVSVSFKGERNHFCGGSLISPTWVLTAGHCGAGLMASQIDAVIGEHDRYKYEGTEQRISVRRIIPHKDFIWTNSRLENDIALLELERPVLLNAKAQLVCLPPFGYRPPIGTKCYLTGWGMTSMPGERAQILQQAMFPVVDKRHCFYNDHYLCFGYGHDSPISACDGDSGGPFVCPESDGRWVQHGVASFVVSRCKYYTGSTPVGPYRNWINATAGV